MQIYKQDNGICSLIWDNNYYKIVLYFCALKEGKNSNNMAQAHHFDRVDNLSRECIFFTPWSRKKTSGMTGPPNTYHHEWLALWKMHENVIFGGLLPHWNFDGGCNNNVMVEMNGSSKHCVHSSFIFCLFKSKFLFTIVDFLMSMSRLCFQLDFLKQVTLWQFRKWGIFF